MTQITADGVYIHAGEYQKRDLLDAFATMIKTHGEFDEGTGTYRIVVREITMDQLRDEIEMMVNQILKPYRLKDDA